MHEERVIKLDLQKPNCNIVLHKSLPKSYCRKLVLQLCLWKLLMITL